MKHFVLTLILTSTVCFSVAQEKNTKKKEVIVEKNGWKHNGKATFLFNQSAFSNWAAGGDNTLAGNVNFNYNFNYKKDNFIWNNKIVASYGITKSHNVDYSKKTNDGMMYNSMFGFDADNYWFYSLLINFKTQFTKGYKYKKDAEKKEYREEYTNFMSPGYLLIGPGMLWEKNKDLKLNLAPATSKLIFVDDKYTTPNGGYFGVEEGESLRYEIGFSASFYYKFKVMTNVTMENVLAFYSNYIDNPQNIDMNYTLNLDMNINKYLSADFIFQSIYDDNAYSGFQIREVFGIGLNYSFKY